MNKTEPALVKIPSNACGAWCLAAVLGVLGKDCTLEEVYRLSGRSEGRKLTMLDLQRAAGAKGVYLEGQRRTIEDIRHVRLPAILAVRMAGGPGPEDHFVVLASCSGASVDIVDPNTRSRRTWTMDELRRVWPGKLLEPRPAEPVVSRNIIAASFVLFACGCCLWFVYARHRARAKHRIGD